MYGAILRYLAIIVVISGTAFAAEENEHYLTNDAKRVRELKEKLKTVSGDKHFSSQEKARKLISELKHQRDLFMEDTNEFGDHLRAVLDEIILQGNYEQSDCEALQLRLHIYAGPSLKADCSNLQTYVRDGLDVLGMVCQDPKYSKCN